MPYLNTDSLEYPISEQQINDLHPLTVFPQPFSPPEPFVWVFPSPQPQFDAVSKYVVEGSPALSDKGHWEQAWEVRGLSEEVAAANRIAAFRAKQVALRNAVQLHMDKAAQALGYDDIKTAVTYAEEPAVPKFQAEAQAFRAWRSQVWAFCYSLLDDVAAGRALEPTEAALIAVLPPLELPE